MTPRETAGGVVLGPDGRIVVVNQGSNVWSLPKGGVDEGESLADAARREVTEECGLTDLTLHKELGSYSRYRTGKGGIGEVTTEPIKHITIFLFTTAQTALVRQEGETVEVRWATVDEATEMLTHPKDKEFLRSVRGIIG